MNKAIFEVSYDEYVGHVMDPVDFGIKFDVEPCFRAVYEELEQMGEDMDKFARSVIKKVVKNYHGKRALLNELGEEESTPLAEFDYLAQNEYIYDILFLYNNEFSSTQEMIKELDTILQATTGHEFGTVGYSSWCYVLYPKGNLSFAKDLWDGTNFYCVSQLEEQDGELVIIDSLCSIYLPDFDKELPEAIAENFDVKDFVLVGNDCVTYSDLPKVQVKEIVTRVIQIDGK